MGFLDEGWSFLKYRKKLWLAPILVVMAVVGAFAYFSTHSALAPFLYTLF